MDIFPKVAMLSYPCILPQLQRNAAKILVQRDHWTKKWSCDSGQQHCVHPGWPWVFISVRSPWVAKKTAHPNISSVAIIENLHEVVTTRFSSGEIIEELLGKSSSPIFFTWNPTVRWSSRDPCLVSFRWSHLGLDISFPFWCVWKWLGVSQNEHGWFIVETPNQKWMRTGGTPMTSETSGWD